MLDGNANFTKWDMHRSPVQVSSHPSGIDKPDGCGGLPAYQSLPAPLDTDHDGMPDNGN